MLQKIEEEENKSNNIVPTIVVGNGGFAEGRSKKK
jgi:hypothetical protein